MKLRLLILLAAALAASPAAGQTIKSLGYNTTNGSIVYSGTNDLRFPATIRIGTNQSGFSSGGQFLTLTDAAGGVAMIIGTNAITSYDPIAFSSTGNAAATRTNLGGTTVGNALFTAATTNAARVALGATVVGENIFTVPLQYQELFLRINADNTVSSLSPAATRTNLGLGATNNVTFSNITASGTLAVTGNVTMSGVDNLAAQQTASSGASLMTRDLSDARYGERTVLYLTNFVSVTNSTTPVDTPLSASLSVGNYLVRSALFAENAASAPGHAFQFGFTGSASPSRLLGQIGTLSGAGIRLDFPLTITRSVSNSFITVVNVEGYLKVTGTGTLTVKYAQQTATTNVSQLKEGFLEVIKLP